MPEVPGGVNNDVGTLVVEANILTKELIPELLCAHRGAVLRENDDGDRAVASVQNQETFRGLHESAFR